MNKQAHLIYNIVEQTDEGVTIAFNGFVGDPEEGNDPTSIANVLHANKGKAVKLQIHSPGGFAADGIHIHDLLAMHDGPVVTELHGWSASAATIISQAGHRAMSANASMLIHKAWGLTVGNATDHMNAAATMERMDESIIAIYLKKGAKKDKVYELMAQDGGHGKFISAQEALDAGLIDEMNLSEKLSNIEAKRSEILAKLESESDSLDKGQFQDLTNKAKSLREEADVIRSAMDEARTQGVNKHFANNDGKSAIKSFDFKRFLNTAAGRTPLEGAEAEVVSETKKAYENSGLAVDGYTIPTALFNAHAAGTTNAGEELIVTTQGDFIRSLKPYSVMIPAGAQVREGLVGILEYGANTTPAEAGSRTEVQAAEDFTMNTVNRTLAPQRGAVKSLFSKSLMLQTSYNIQEEIRSELLAAMMTRIDKHAVIESYTNAGSTVAIGTNGGAITRAKVIELMFAPLKSNSNGLNNSFITNPFVAEAASNIAIDAGSGRFLWNPEVPNSFMGRPAYVTNNVPSNLSKGSASGTLSSLIYGDFSSVTIGMWGGLDLVVDNYTVAETGQIKLVLNFFHDSVVRQPGNLAAINDILP